MNSKLGFIVASDDRKWCQEMFEKETDVIMTQRLHRPDLDLAILSQCNHTIISFGTFSFWSAFLKPEGEVVVADGYASQETILLTYIKQFLPKWTLISDPCFTNTSSLDTVPRLTKLCHDKKDEYGIFDD